MDHPCRQPAASRVGRLQPRVEQIRRRAQQAASWRAEKRQQSSASNTKSIHLQPRDRERSSSRSCVMIPPRLGSPGELPAPQLLRGRPPARPPAAGLLYSNSLTDEASIPTAEPCFTQASWNSRGCFSKPSKPPKHGRPRQSCPPHVSR